MKENKQLQENVKLLAAEAEKLSETDSLKRAKEIMDKANKV
jgi:import inner membrane translocase subunit TIM44